MSQGLFFLAEVTDSNDGASFHFYITLSHFPSGRSSQGCVRHLSSTLCSREFLRGLKEVRRHFTPRLNLKKTNGYAPIPL